MLTLTSRINERFFILKKGNDDPLITLKLLEIEFPQVKLGFDAPEDISILREKLYQRLLEEGKPLHRLKKTT